MDVPGVLDGNPILRLQARGARHGETSDPEWALPHGQELAQPFPREYPPQDKVTHLERHGADTVIVVKVQLSLGDFGNS